MEAPQPTSTKPKLWRWLLLLSVITIALGGFVWWKSRSERLQFVEPIWSDSLPGHDNDSAATGQRRKIGEVWSLTCSSGFSLFDRGLKREFEGRYPVFTPGNRFQRALSEKLLAELRDFAHVKYDASKWWDSIKASRHDNQTRLRIGFELLVFHESAVSLRSTVDYYEGRIHEGYGSTGHNVVDRNGALHDIQLSEFFRNSEWQKALADICLMDFNLQKASFIGEKADEERRTKLINDHLARNSFAIAPKGLFCFFSSYWFDPNRGREVVVFIPFEALAVYLRPDSPHRMFQMKISE